MNNLSGKKIYYLIGAAVLLILIAGAAILIFPNLTKDLSEKVGITKKEAPQLVEKYNISGEIIDIDYDEGIVTIKDNETGKIYKVKIDPNAKISAGATGGAFSLSQLKVGQQISIVVKGPSGTDGGKKDGDGDGSTTDGGKDSGGDGGGDTTDGTDGGDTDGGGDGNGGGDEDIIIIDPEDEIDIYYPYPTISTKLLSIDSSNKTLPVETIGSPSGKFQVKVTNKTEFTKIAPDPGESTPDFGDLKVGQILNINTKEDPTTNPTVTAILINIIEDV